MNKYKTLEEFFTDQSTEKSEQIKLIRNIILESAASLEETLKWNAPNYIFNGQDRITFNVMNKQNKVKVVLHMGAVKKEDKSGKPVLDNDYGIAEWNSNIRATVTFDSLEDIKAKSIQFKNLVADWLKID